MGIPDHLTCLLRNLYAGQEATDRTLYGTTDWFMAEKSMTRLSAVTLFIHLICRAHHDQCQTGWVTSWNQDRQEKYQQPQICGWYHSNGRKRERTKEPLNEDERREWKSLLKTTTVVILLSNHPLCMLIFVLCIWVLFYWVMYINEYDILLLFWSLYHYMMPFFVFLFGLCFKVYFAWYEYSYPPLSCFHLHEIILFHPIIFSPRKVSLLWAAYCRLFFNPVCHFMSFDGSI